MIRLTQGDLPAGLPSRRGAPGCMLICARAPSERPRYIINFPTKRHWRNPSRMEDVESGLAALVAEVRCLGIRSVAVPALGCGLGGLPWPEVSDRMRHAFEAAPDVLWLVYGPGGSWRKIDNGHSMV